jgi:hypothetical protein
VRNIFLFIRRYFNVLLFLILEIFSLSMLFTYNRYHEAFMMGITGDFTGKFYTQYSKVRNYFHLKEEPGFTKGPSPKLSNDFWTRNDPKGFHSSGLLGAFQEVHLEERRRHQ